MQNPFKLLEAMSRAESNECPMALYSSAVSHAKLEQGQLPELSSN
jgi:hypothetical protein